MSEDTRPSTDYSAGYSAALADAAAVARRHTWDPQFSEIIALDKMKEDFMSKENHQQCAYCHMWFLAPVGLHHESEDCARLEEAYNAGVAAEREHKAHLASELCKLQVALSEKPRNLTLLPEEFQRFWEACVRLVDKAEFGPVLRHVEKLETTLSSERERYNALWEAAEDYRSSGSTDNAESAALLVELAKRETPNAT